MKELIFLFSMILLMVMNFRCNSPDIQSQWTNDNLLLKEVFTDSLKISDRYLKEINASIAFHNNSEYLYIILNSSDVFINRLIKIRGVTVWFNASNKKQKIYGVRYGRQNPAGFNPQMRDSFWESMTSDQKMRLTEHQKARRQMITIINKGTEKQIPPNNPEWPAFAQAFSGEKYYLVFRIPIIHSDDNPNPSKMNKVVVGVELGNADQKRPDQMGPPMGGMPGMGGGGLGRRGETMRNAKPKYQRFTHKEIWLNVILEKG